LNRQTRKSSSRRFKSVAFALRFDPFPVGVMGVLALALLVGGASRENPIQVAIIEFACLILLPFALWRVADGGYFKAIWLPVVVIVLTVLVPLLQLVPLPPDIWSHLAGREQVVSVYRALGIALPWRPVSLTPNLTIHSGLALIVPITVFLSWVTLTPSARRTGIGLILIVVLLGLVLGAVQMAGGGQNVGYLYQNTNFGSLVGFFSNRNHEGALLVCCLPLAAALIVQDRRVENKRILLAILCVSLAMVVALAIVAVRSRAALALLLPATLAAILVALPAANGRKKVVVFGAGAAAILVGAVVLLFGMNALKDRWGADIASDLRFAVSPIIWRAGLHYLPFGTGLGSFDTLYRSIEPIRLVSPMFLNHAHDDYLELFLETGLACAIPLLAFVIWWVGATWRAWMGSARREYAIAKGASLVVLLLLCGSIVDYPLRTLALSSVFACACALMIPVKTRGEGSPSGKRQKR
jgi:O-antigen ligase